MSNTLRRTRIKLELFNQEGVNELLFDLLDKVNDLQRQQRFVVSITDDKLRQAGIIRELKLDYTIIVEALSPTDPSQSKLFNDDET